MNFLYNQPIAHRFGVTLTQLIESGEWHSVDAAVAWVRRSGTKHLLPSLVDFLRRGGSARFTIGIDIENTSQEGLQDLLSLGNAGTAETFIYHNEFDVTFHPKVYLFSTNDRARLIVGSNNLTEAGLFTNTEAGLQIDGALTDPVIMEAHIALASWRDPSEQLAKQLDDVLLNDLVRGGYVFPEAALRRRRADSKRNAVARREAAAVLFGRRRFIAPPPPPAHPVGVVQVGRVLLMRVRRA